jgi:photosystem II stability/assembly factor-like uncharacterized protein
MRSSSAWWLLCATVLACSSSNAGPGSSLDASTPSDATSPFDGGTLEGGAIDAGADAASDGAGGDGATPPPGWMPRGFSGVVVQALAVDPATPSTVYVGTAGMGIYRSKDSGASWSPVDTGLPDANQTVASLAVDPKAAGTLYLGLASAGLYRSTDGGDTWTSAFGGATDGGAPDSGAPDGGSPAITPVGIVVDPSGSGTVWAVDADQGLFASLDRGSTWTKPPNTNLPLGRGALHGLAFEPKSQTLLCMVDSLVLMKSNDGGATWTSAADGLVVDAGVAGDAGAPGDVLTIVAQPGGTLFAETRGAGLFTNADAAQSWTAVTTPQTTGFAGLALDPANPNTLYVSSGNGGILRSIDGGGSWTFGGPPVGVLTIVVASDGSIYLATAAGTGVWSREPMTTWP